MAKPHIIMTLADDIGWANTGWNRPTASAETETPNLDTLVRDGIQLEHFYTFKYCGPSRSAFLSGRNPTHVNVVNGHTTSVNPDDPVSGFSGIPTSMTSVAEKMVSAGYSAHAVGKWDGACCARLSPCPDCRTTALTCACCRPPLDASLCLSRDGDLQAHARRARFRVVARLFRALQRRE